MLAGTVQLQPVLPTTMGATWIKSCRDMTVPAKRQHEGGFASGFKDEMLSGLEMPFSCPDRAKQPMSVHT